jgi:dTDP-4-amino-4,6-dideoxygalactose transaminase
MAFKDLSLMKDNKKNIVLFYPHISKNSIKSLKKTLSTRWIGQGPMVEKFEKKISHEFANKLPVISTGSGTDALHLAYLLAGIKKNDEVIAPVFTCTATNIPLLYIGAKIKFADLDKKTMNICINSVKRLITKKTKAIICVHYGGLPCDLKELQELADKFKIPLIEDAAHALGAEYNNKKIGSISDFTIFSFQAIKHITTGDGGALCIKNKKLLDKAKRLRWFGIDRKKKQLGIWENDIKEVGYKYQMTDLGATLGYESLLEFKNILKHRRDIYQVYLNELTKNRNIFCVHEESKIKKHAAWMFTILVEKKIFLQNKLRTKGIETNQVHFRNDKYSIFKEFVKHNNFPNMDYVENKYLVLPVHTKMTLNDASRVAKEINRII